MSASWETVRTDYHCPNEQWGEGAANDSSDPDMNRKYRPYINKPLGTYRSRVAAPGFPVKGLEWIAVIQA